MFAVTIFCLAYFGIALGKIPGLIIDRVGIALKIVPLAFDCMIQKMPNKGIEMGKEKTDCPEGVWFKQRTEEVGFKQAVAERGSRDPIPGR